MTDYPHLPNAPIEEAIIDIRVNDAHIDPGKSMDDMYQALSSSFVTKDLRRNHQVMWDMQDANGPKVSMATEGYAGWWYATADGMKILQARRDGFTYSHRRPYSNWQTFSSEARTYWDLYMRFAEPASVHRLAVRYVNRFEIPIPKTHLSEYLKVLPVLPEGIGPSIGGFTLRILFPILPDVGGNCQFTSSLGERAPGMANAPIVIDIDAFVTRSYPTTSGDIWNVLELLHDEKNRFFFGSVTAECLRLFE